jgi:DNA-binding response OmpR family regulator
VATVLVCEDDADIRGLIAAALEESGDTVCHASEVAGAIAAIVERSSIDVVVTDIGLPDGSGLDVCRAGRDAGLRVVAITADVDEDLRARLAPLAAELLVKPFALAALVRAVRGC